MTYNPSSILDRYHWWASLKHGGLLIAPAKLAEFFPEQAEPLPRYLADRLRRDVTRLQNGDDAHLGALLDTVLEAVLALDKAWWLKGPVVDSRWGQKAVTGETIKPRRVWQNDRGAVLPVFTTDRMPGGAITRIGVGRGRRAVSRVIEWLRKSKLKIGLLTNGRQWRLIHAEADYDAWAEWDIDFWFEEGQPGPQVEALRILLGQMALSSPDTPAGEESQAPLPAAIQASRQGQAELSSVLGERVRQAVELLIRESAPNIEDLIAGNSQSEIRNSEIYIAATRVIMRCVIILFAEARELLPLVNPRYHQSYGIQGLREQLDRRAGGRPERLRHSYSAWPRLLALFRLVYFGSDHGDLAVPRYGGGLFAPGEPDGDDPVQRALTAFETIDPCPSDAAVYRLLGLLTRSQVKVRQGRSSTWVEAPVDFSDLSSEYIGILYEGLLDFELRQAEADEPLLFLNLGDQPVLPLTRLEAMDDKALAALVEKFGKPAKPQAGDEADEDEETVDEEELEEEETDDDDVSDDAVALVEDDEEADDLTAQIHEQAHNWAVRAVEAGKLVRRPRSRSREAQAGYEQAVSQMASRLVGRIILPGGWFLVRWGGTRKGSGTFYTRPQLAVPTVRRTLEPLVYDRPTAENGQSPTDGKTVENSQLPTFDNSQLVPKTPAEILSLQVCDPAMGSGSFLIAALRYLTEALYESLHTHGHIEAHGAGALCRLPDGRETNSTLDETLPLPPDHPDFEARLKARLRRHVVERCLYGVDLNPLAVELARLALWVETMDRSLPFEFLDHKLKCGNALVGCWFDRFRDYPVMAWEREGGDKNHSRFVHHYREVTDKKGKATSKGDVWTQAIKDKKNDLIKPEMIRWLQAVAGQTDFSDVLGQTPDALHLRQQRILLDLHALNPAEPERKADLYRRQVLHSAERQRLLLAFDTWCALWFWPGDRLDDAPLPRDFFNPTPEAQAIIADLTARYRFFHWELEYPDVFIAENAGFDAMVGNPPWDTLKPNSKEFFSNLDPLYRTYGKQEALSRQDELFEVTPQIERDWLVYNAQIRALANWSKYAFAPFGDHENDSDNFNFTRSRAENEGLHNFWRRRRKDFHGYADTAHPFRFQGSADLNTYKQFTELSYALLKPLGRLGLIIPSGIYSDKGTENLRKLFLETCDWELLFGFINWNKIFAAVYYRFKFCIIIVQKDTLGTNIAAAFLRYHIEEWEQANDYVFAYPVERVNQFSSKTKSILEMRTAQDLSIMEKLYSDAKILGDTGKNQWNVTFDREFDMTTNSKVFPPYSKWVEQGYIADEYGHWLKGKWHIAEKSEGLFPKQLNGTIFSKDRKLFIPIDEVEDVAIPLYEGRMIGQFDFSQKGWVSGKGRTAIWQELPWDAKFLEPQFLGALSEVNKINPNLSVARPHIMRIASATNTRTVYCTLVNGVAGESNTPVLTPGENHLYLPFVGILNSFTFDWQIRNRISGLTVDWHFLEQTALLSISSLHPIISRLALKLNCISTKFANEWLHYIESRELNSNWYYHWAITPHERLRLHCVLDAIIAELYGLDLKDYTWMFHNCDHPVETMRDRNFYRTLDPKGFWRVDKGKEPELRHTVLAQVAFHELQQKGLDAFLSQNNGEGWLLPESLRLADFGLGHDDRAREPQPVAARLGPRFLPWQLEKSVEESWAECERHAENLRLLLGGSEVEEEAESEEGPTDLFGQPVQRDLFGNVVYPKGKGRKR